jgi:hypothetical protein
LQAGGRKTPRAAFSVQTADRAEYPRRRAIVTRAFQETIAMRKLILAALVAAAFSIPAFAAQTTPASPAAAAAPAAKAAPSAKAAPAAKTVPAAKVEHHAMKHHAMKHHHAKKAKASAATTGSK